MKNKPIENQDDLFINEINEGLKQDQMKKLWDKYGVYVIIFIATILTATVSFESFKAWQAKKSQEVSNAFATSLNLYKQGQTEKSISILKSISDGSSKIYGDIAELQTANILLDQGKNEEAFKILQFITENANNTQIGNIAAIKLASYKIDTAPFDEVNAILAPISKSNSPWTVIANELIAMLHIRENNLEEAQKIYMEILSMPNLSDTTKSRAQDMLSIINTKK